MRELFLIAAQAAAGLVIYVTGFVPPTAGLFGMGCTAGLTLMWLIWGNVSIKMDTLRDEAIKEIRSSVGGRNG